MLPKKTYNGEEAGPPVENFIPALPGGLLE